ncbi:MAG: serine/threonine protein kinase [Chloroflexi bacterium]|nr:serine/threonine protein kinase [Chloroflexota bacterium]
MTQPLPEMLGKYKIRREIGRGANAVVYEALDTTLDRVVALKVLHAGIYSDPVLVSRFEQEAKAAAKLDHQHIVTIYEIGEWQGAHYIAMKYIPGRDLRQVIKEEGAIPPSRVIAIVRQVADGLDYAHARGFIHRDIKPSNIILGADDAATVTDFGLVKATESSASLSSGAIIGTPAYIAPEVWEGRQASAQTDIYALGVVVCELLTGRVPFDAETPAAVMWRHPVMPVRPMTGLPDGVMQAVLKALAKEPSERYARAGEFAAAFALALQLASVPRLIDPPPPIETPKPEAKPPARPKKKTWALVVAGIAAVFLILSVVFAAAGLFAPPSRQMAGITEATPSALPVSSETVAGIPVVSTSASTPVTTSASIVPPTVAPTGPCTRLLPSRHGRRGWWS